MYPMGYYCCGLQNTLHFQHCHQHYYLSDFFKFHDLKLFTAHRKYVFFSIVSAWLKKEDKKMRKKIPQPYGPEFKLDVCDTISEAERKDAQST